MTPYTEKENFYIIRFRIDLIKKMYQCSTGNHDDVDIDARK